MPNHITNLISFGDQPEQVAAFHQMLRDLRQKGGVYGSIDFNKLIPMPKALDIESGTRTTNGLDAYRRFITGDKAGAEAFQKEHPEEWALGKQAYENIQQYGSPTWYEWCNKNWGTKWNAYSCVELGKDDDTLEFFTAWSSVPTILEALSRKYPDQTISYCWADEDIGSNVGEAVYKNGEMIDAERRMNWRRISWGSTLQTLTSISLRIKAPMSTMRTHPKQNAPRMGRRDDILRTGTSETVCRRHGDRQPQVYRPGLFGNAGKGSPCPCAVCDIRPRGPL